MKLQEQIKNTATLSIVSALITVVLILGGFFDLLDFTCASVSAFIIHVICSEKGYKSATLVYCVSAVLSNLFLPLRSCPIIFTAFFGYFPILRIYLSKKIKSSRLVYAILLALFNGVMCLLYILFKEVFGIDGEPIGMVIALLVSANVFYICFELLMRRIMILYNYYIKKKLK